MSKYFKLDKDKREIVIDNTKHYNVNIYILDLIIDLKQEIERLKEQLSDEIDEELKQSEIMVKKQQEIEILNKELEQRTKQYENALKRYQDLENKTTQTEYNNKKAIEYIYNNYPVCAGKELLEILEGEDNGF